jgi:hypothetical protein
MQALGYVNAEMVNIKLKACRQRSLISNDSHSSVSAILTALGRTALNDLAYLDCNQSSPTSVVIDLVHSFDCLGLDATHLPLLGLSGVVWNSMIGKLI